MIRKIILIFLSFSGFFVANSGLASMLSNLHPSVWVGTGNTHVGSSDNVWLAHTPCPGLENNYTSSNNPNTFYLGLALEKSFRTDIKNLQVDLGVEGGYLKTGTANGIVHPMVNVASDFDTLNYTYKMDSYLIFLEASLSKLNMFHHVGVYVQGGVGSAFNQLYEYTEASPAGSSAAPMVEPFHDGFTNNSAYFLGAGVVWNIPRHLPRLSIGYRYIHTGQSNFDRTPVQQSNEKLGFSYNHHFLVLNLMI